MPVYALGREPRAFPPPEGAVRGLVAVGGDLSPERLLLAYRSGIFPWYDEGPILWHSPDPRCVLPIGGLHVGRTLRRVITQGRYVVKLDTAFDRVIARCRTAPRPGQDGTWITTEMQAAYVELHRLGYAHSVEAYEEGELAGGLYGVSLGRMFFGESMFSERPNASKVAPASASAEKLAAWGFPLRRRAGRDAAHDGHGRRRMAAFAISRCTESRACSRDEARRVELTRLS